VVWIAMGALLFPARQTAIRTEPGKLIHQAVAGLGLDGFSHVCLSCCPSEMVMRVDQSPRICDDVAPGFEPFKF
jgi:hypothetical protein